MDWLRAIVLAILWFYHTGLIFNGTMSFHIMNNESIPGLDHLLYFFHQWRLGLLFLISGMGSYFALRKYRKRFLGERVRRLLIPLFFGILIIVPPQVYAERLFNGFQYNSFIEFYLGSFSRGLYPYGDVSWHHLWYLAYLFIYGLMFILIAKLLKKKEGLTKLYSPALLVIPLIIAEALLKPYSLGVQNIVQDSAMFVSYFLIYVFGILFCADHAYFEKIEKAKHIYFLLALILTVAIYLFPRFATLEFAQPSPSYYLNVTFHSAQRWFCILAIMGYAIRYLNIENRFISMVNPAILPLYMLHQTFTIVIWYYVIQLSMAPTAKLFTIIFTSLVASLLLYYYLIIKVRPLRILFGIEK